MLKNNTVGGWWPDISVVNKGKEIHFVNNAPHDYYSKAAMILTPRE
jgi:hypothetical protein